jgi:hypothetical protein
MANHNKVNLQNIFIHRNAAPPPPTYPNTHVLMHFNASDPLKDATGKNYPYWDSLIPGITYYSSGGIEMPRNSTQAITNVFNRTEIEAAPFPTGIWTVDFILESMLDQYPNMIKDEFLDIGGGMITLHINDVKQAGYYSADNTITTLDIMVKTSYGVYTKNWTFTPPYNSWPNYRHHFAFISSGQNSNLLFSIDGYIENFDTNWHGIVPIITRGISLTTGNNTMTLREFRISNIARWTSNFTPPTPQYPVD